MKILNKKLKSKNIGIVILISSTLLSLTIILLTITFFVFGLKSGVNILLLVPLISISLIALSFSIFGIYSGVRYIKGKSFKQNKQLGSVLLILGGGYLGYTLLSYIFSNLTGNYGGEFRIVLALFVAIISIPLGLAFKNGCTENDN